MKATGSVEIDRPIDEVFRVTNEHVPEWSIIVVEDRIIDEQPGGVGTTFVTVTEDRGRRMEFQGVVTRHDSPRAHAIHLAGEMFDIDTEYVFKDLGFKDLGGRTRVTQLADVTGKNVFFRAFTFLFGWLMKKSQCKAADDEMQSLKRFCESQPRDVTD